MDISYNLKEAHMIKAIKHQTSFILKQNTALIVFYILLAIAFFNFSSNVLTFQGSDIIEMYHPAKLLVLSYNQTYNKADITLLVIQLYPILIVCPAGFTLLSEKKRFRKNNAISSSFWINVGFIWCCEIR